jgi:hypothetical protein
MRRLGYLALLSSLTVTVIAFAVVVGEGIDAYYRPRLVDMVHGTAYRPYVSRVLVILNCVPCPAMCCQSGPFPFIT